MDCRTSSTRFLQREQAVNNSNQKEKPTCTVAEMQVNCLLGLLLGVIAGFGAGAILVGWAVDKLSHFPWFVVVIWVALMVVWAGRLRE